VGVRVTFDPERLFAARERRLGRPVAREVTGTDGLVVDEALRGVLKWPCRLWRVDDLQGAVRLLPSNMWLRCKALTVLEELPAWLVMGAHGDAVVGVLEQARNLSSDQVRAIAELPDAEEQRLSSAVWDRWLLARDSGFPIGRGSDVVASAVEEAARRTDQGLFGWDEVDEVEVLANPSWRQARRAAVAAALAVGAPETLGEHDTERLGWRWMTVAGRPDVGS
jgi:hypothetical protein